MNEIDISVRNVGVVYQKGSFKSTAIENVNFDVRRGELFCILGPSGCGKSTLLKVLIGLLSPSSGEIHISKDRFEQGIAYVQQSSTLLPWRTLLQNAALGLELNNKLSADSLDYIHSQIRNYQLDGFENNLSSELSGGMRQRVDIIRALAKRPSLLFCDEPFSAIDFVSRLKLSTHFRYMCKVQKTTTVFVTHNIEEAIFLGDKIAIMSKRPGKIIRVYEPKLSSGREDAVLCRGSSEFPELFNSIWEDLRKDHDLSL